MTQFSIDRRSLFKGAGALIVSIGLPGAVATAEIGSAVKPPLSPDRLDSWLAVKADGDVVAYFGKMDMGQGVDVAIAQIVADELDVPFERVSIVMGDTAWTVNQGGASGSTGNGVASPGHTGTEGSNLSPSSGESCANLIPRSGRRITRVSGLRSRRGRQRAAGPANSAPTRSNISVGPYSSTAFRRCGRDKSLD